MIIFLFKRLYIDIEMKATVTWKKENTLYIYFLFLKIEEKLLLVKQFHILYFYF